MHARQPVLCPPIALATLVWGMPSDVLGIGSGEVARRLWPIWQSLRANNGEAMLPSLIAGHGFAVLPEFLVTQALADGRLQILWPSWRLPAAAVHWVSPPVGPKPGRVSGLADFFAARPGARRAEGPPIMVNSQ